MKKLFYVAVLVASAQAFAIESANEPVSLDDYPECSQSINADCQAYVESLIANSEAEESSSVKPNRRDFGDCRDDWSCDKEDLKNYLGKNRGDLIGRPAPTPVPEPNTMMVFLLGISVLVAGRALKLKRNQ